MARKNTDNGELLNFKNPIIFVEYSQKPLNLGYSPIVVSTVRE